MAEFEYTDKEREFLKRFAEEAYDIAMLRFGGDHTVIGTGAKVIALAIYRALKEVPSGLKTE